MTVRRNPVEFDYNGKVRPARIDSYYSNGDKLGDNLVFSYKQITVDVDLDDEIHEHVAERECKLIDDLGEDDYNMLSKYRKKINQIERSNVVLNNKVYNYHHDTVKSGSVVYHTMLIKMQDGMPIFGDSPFSFAVEDDKKSKIKTFNNLINNVKQYHKNTGNEPDEMSVNEELTLEYMQMKNWITKKINQSTL
ncbi:hypothetical protein J7J00_17805 [Bacillus sp. ISL-4]|uniref:hypothetical protein n=1 Tax=Bacillus sp. ISL-4 TaxID=2819125 RepID=UPI001BE64A13|nr:hypothetical protein [Bacillus sp. ISL-4]MBT2667335.1 hypothetical protein [Bacillus sp. ISL-4]MBT2669429.1 hypothetical protein [Streptomyces sp. ISL-14]